MNIILFEQDEAEVLTSVPLGGYLISYAIPSFHAQSYRFGSFSPTVPLASQAERPSTMTAVEGRSRAGGNAPALG
jgi:hypothetical protein